MTNLDNAVEAILSRYSILGTVRARAAAHALEEAGLLMPDLPEPGNNHSPSWGVVHFDKQTGAIKIGLNGVFTRSPKAAREWAYGLLAAADCAEKEQGNE